jgi:ribosomal protein L29
MKSLMEKKKNDLLKELAEKRAALGKFQFNIAGSKVRNMKEGKNLRKDVARILTVLNHPNYENK